MASAGERTIAALRLRGRQRPDLARQVKLQREKHHESTHHTFFDDNDDALFGGSICHGVTTAWACAEQSVAGDVETQSREIDLSARRGAEERHLQLPRSRSKSDKHRRYCQCGGELNKGGQHAQLRWAAPS